MAENKDQQEATELLGGVDHHLTYPAVTGARTAGTV